MKIILVLSGKGGVGKSTFCAALSIALAVRGNKRVGILDADLCGPSISSLFPQEKRPVMMSEAGWIPLKSTVLESISVISIGYLLPSADEAVIWRGPKKSAMLSQLLHGVSWGPELDYLVIDTPPGTSDEHITLAQLLADDMRFVGAIVVTTPQWAALSDVRKEIEFCRLVKIPIVGLVENMRQVACEHCSECTAVFGSGEGAKALAAHYGIPFLASLPLVPQYLQEPESGEFVQNIVNSPTLAYFDPILAHLS